MNENTIFYYSTKWETKLIDIMSQIILNDILINEISISLLD